MTTKFLKYYKDLPDSMQTNEVKQEFDKLVDLDVDNSFTVYDICDALYELADRQYHTYEILDPETKAKIAKWVEKNWVNDLRFVRNLGMIGGSIGIRQISDLLKLQNTRDKPIDIKTEIENTIAEIEPNIENPYVDLE